MSLKSTIDSNVQVFTAPPASSTNFNFPNNPGVVIAGGDVGFFDLSATIANSPSAPSSAQTLTAIGAVDTVTGQTVISGPVPQGLGTLTLAKPGKILVTPTNLNFPVTGVGATSPTKSFFIKNLKQNQSAGRRDQGAWRTLHSKSSVRPIRDCAARSQQDWGQVRSDQFKGLCGPRQSVSDRTPSTAMESAILRASRHHQAATCFGPALATANAMVIGEQPLTQPPCHRKMHSDTWIRKRNLSEGRQTSTV